ncbi:MAG: AMP-binding protein [Alphaproteobacteria bacterium]|nr:AMP-binding protein [Alphaproteobacteria bacterium]MDX5369639.1 AMP-binding protein [Alphaproteobacteria bacterium]MDX5464274.1 AMP-binding protein [Alphaproteobacteria bacterium]
MTTADAAARPVEDTVPKLLLRNVARFGDRPANREKEYGIWQTWTWAQVAGEIEALALGMGELGLARGDKVAIIGTNRPQLYWAMVAVQSMGAIPVPVYQDSVAEEMHYVLEHAEVRFAVVEDQEQVDKLILIKDRLPNLKAVVHEDTRGLRHYTEDYLHHYGAVQDLGRTRAAAAPDLWKQEIGKGGWNDIAVILYTSGTTGRPKGVVLSFENIITASRVSCAFDNLTETEEVLAYLPMAWVGDHIFSIGQSYFAGFCVSCPESEDTVAQNLRELGPTYYFAPPRVFENLLTSVTIRMEDASAIKRRMFNHFMAHARRVGPDILDGKAVSFGDRLLYWLGDILVYGPLKNVLGLSKLRLGYTAGEAIGPEIFQFYRSLGINLKQLYGQTEASVFITAHPDGEVRADTVGVPAPSVEVRIDEETGEVMYRSPGVFVEYYKNPEATAETKTPDGWVHTGDAGFFVEDGHLKIIDRAKDVGRLQDGSLFPPKYVENKLKFFPNIMEAVAIGHERPYVTALVNIDLNAVGNWAERNNVSYGSYQELAQHPEVGEMIRAHVEEVNRSLAGEDHVAGCQIHRFLILHKELDADDGELTRTRKVRRRFVADRYAPLIEALYSGKSEQYVETEVTYEDGRTGVLKATVKIHDAKTVPLPGHTAQAAE